MPKFMMRILTVLCFAVFLAGCGGEVGTVSRTAIELKKNGSVVHTIVDDFAESYYDIEELKNTIVQACDTYNDAAGKEAVKMESAEAADGTATVVMTYDSAQSYSDFNRQALFAGTVKDAFKAGYDLNVTLFPVREGETAIKKDELLGMGEKKIAIVREAVDVKVWGKIRYLSEDAVLGDDADTASVTDENSLTYILFD